LSLTHSWDHSAEKLPDLFDRNVRALGGEVQRVLQDLRIGVVGCGGIGSCVAEQLVRLGVRQFVLVDPDTLSVSNLTRVYGSTAADIGRRKVDIVADNLARISPEACSTRIASMITCEAIARQLVELDLVFGCTDDNAGRLVLSRLATYMLIPVIDCGVILTSNRDGLLEGIDGRVTTLTPGSACLVCRGRIDLERARSELLTPEERVRREDEGYAPALRGVEPAVVAYTTLVAATAVGELLERLVHYGSDLTPSETLLRVHEREISTNVQLPRERHYCHPDSGKLGLGLTEPFLEQTWPA
jgi:molybdopterin/thiamine biosynthesis adenylyltransferase